MDTSERLLDRKYFDTVSKNPLEAPGLKTGSMLLDSMNSVSVNVHNHHHCFYSRSELANKLCKAKIILKNTLVRSVKFSKIVKF